MFLDVGIAIRLRFESSAHTRNIPRLPLNCCFKTVNRVLLLYRNRLNEHYYAYSLGQSQHSIEMCNPHPGVVRIALAVRVLTEKSSLKQWASPGRRPAGWKRKMAEDLFPGSAPESPSFVPEQAAIMRSAAKEVWGVQRYCQRKIDVGISSKTGRQIPSLRV